MKRFTSAFLAVASAFVCISISAAARPRYGGTLRIETSASMRSLNPAATPLDAADAAARRLISPLIFETLVTLDASGGVRPLLALDWESDALATRWRFRLRPRVKLHDGTPLDAGRVAAALTASQAGWRVATDTATVTIESDQEMPDLLWRLADPRYAIAFGRPGGGEPIGSGPFSIERWEPKRLRLRAHEDYWGGRPFVDALQVEMARALADQINSIEVGRADFVTLRVQDVRRASQRGLRIATSQPLEIVALVFADNRSRPDVVRRALSLAVDRQTLWNAVLQRQGEPATSLLPKWLSGYSVASVATADRTLARSIVGPLATAQRTLTLGIPEPDPLLRAIAERVAVDARDVGLVINLESPDAIPVRTPDMRLVRLDIEATTPERSLSILVAALGRRVTGMTVDGPPGPGAPLEAVYRFEQAVLDEHTIVPLVHLPQLYAAAPHVESWHEPMVLPSGAWNLADVWLRANTP